MAIPEESAVKILEETVHVEGPASLLPNFMDCGFSNNMEKPPSLPDHIIKGSLFLHFRNLALLTLSLSTEELPPALAGEGPHSEPLNQEACDTMAPRFPDAYAPLCCCWNLTLAT